MFDRKVADPLDAQRTRSLTSTFWRRRFGGVSRGVGNIVASRASTDVDRTVFDRRDGGRDVAVAGQHNDARIGSGLVQHFDKVETVAGLAEPKIDDGESGRGFARNGKSLVDGLCRRDNEAARFHGAGEAQSKRRVIVDDEALSGSPSADRATGDPVLLAANAANGR
jgi:hypothetical protein